LSPEEERDFIKLDLGPTLRADHPSVKIMMLDDQRTHLAKWTDAILSDPEAAKVSRLLV
jgi:O-glycosyl hydrolase